MRFLFLLLILQLTPWAQASETVPNGRETFEELKTLVGDWKITEAGRATTVNYRLTANDSTLVETWVMSPMRQSMTVYTMDGERLIATHYCPQGNAPRLELKKRDKTGASHFLFLDGANLQDPKGSHEHAFWVRIESTGELTRSETYIGNGEKYGPETEQGEPETFRRVGTESSMR